MKLMKKNEIFEKRMKSYENKVEDSIRFYILKVLVGFISSSVYIFVSNLPKNCQTNKGTKPRKEKG